MIVLHLTSAEYICFQTKLQSFWVGSLKNWTFSSGKITVLGRWSRKGFGLRGQLLDLGSRWISSWDPSSNEQLGQKVGDRARNWDQRESDLMCNLRVLDSWIPMLYIQKGLGPAVTSREGRVASVLKGRRWREQQALCDLSKVPPYL